MASGIKQTWSRKAIPEYDIAFHKVRWSSLRFHAAHEKDRPQYSRQTQRSGS